MFRIRREQKDAFAAAFAIPMAPCQRCLVVRIEDIEGLYVAGYDDRGSPPAGTTKGASRLKGYSSQDDKGRIFINRDLDGSWKRDTQGIVITVRVDPPSVAIPAGTEIEWSFEDPDDPSNEDPAMHRDAKKYLDPNDFSADKKTGAKGDDNDPYKNAKAKPGFAEVSARYALSGNKTKIDPATRLSKVRFNVSDVAGDNYIVKAHIEPKSPITTTVDAVTGIMTVWNRIDVEYVKMASAEELPVGELQIHFDKAFAQIDISLKREVSGAADWEFMGRTESEADLWCSAYATRSTGQFTMEGKGGWFFLVAANRYMPEKHVWVMFEGDAVARGQWIVLPPKAPLPDIPKTARIFNPQKVKGLAKPWPANRDAFTAFDVGTPVRFQGAWWLPVGPQDYHEVDSPDKAFLYADLTTYGFPPGSVIQVQILTEGDEVSRPAGLSPGGAEVNGHSYFGGRLMVFTKVLPADLRIMTLCHELCHAFDNSHKCGNWDWTAGASRTACVMTYLRQFVLDNGKPRKPIRWTQNRRSAEFCPQHLRRMRDYHLQDNPGLNWK